MFDKWKVKRALCKAYKLYDKKKILYLKADTIDLYQQLEDIQYAIAYVLCEYFDFNYEFYYDNFPFSYKWYIANDYIHYYDECKKAYEKNTKQNNTTKYDYIAWSTNDFKGKKGDIIYNVDNRRFYYYDGKIFREMC